jgi:hypothetical protein
MTYRKLSWDIHAAPMKKTGNAYEILIRKPIGKTSSGKTKHRYEDIIEIETGCENGSDT